MFKKTASALIVAFATTLSMSAMSAMAADTTTPSSDESVTKGEAKDLKTQSEARYKARKNIAEANEDLAKGNCKTALDGSAKRACEKSARASAKSDKAAAKTVHEVEEKQIKDATK